MSDPTTPDHYRAPSGLSAIEVIEDFGVGFNLGNVIKYVLRAGKKNPNAHQDLLKANWYLQRELLRVERQMAADHAEMVAAEEAKFPPPVAACK
jgi:hypothetical protein